MSEPAADHPNVAFFPPLGALGAPLLALLLEWLAPLRLLPPPNPGALVAGLLIVAAAVGLAVWGIVAFRSAKTNVNPRSPSLKLVATGPYRFTRNPMYLGMVLLQIGIALAASLDWALVFAPLLWAALHFGVVLREEAYLAARFGAPYRAFRDRTRRWL